MKDGPDISRMAALIGDPARANILTALLDENALTASELAAHAGVTRQTASAHLAKLTDGGLLAAEAQGRRRYFRLHDPDVAGTLESLMHLAQRRGGRTRAGPRDPALRQARVCYDHLAGEIGVRTFERMMERGWLVRPAGDISLTAKGENAAGRLGIDFADLRQGRRPLCLSCLDWSVRRHHLAGGLGASLFELILARGWARRVKGSRVVAFSAHGEAALRKAIG